MISPLTPLLFWRLRNFHKAFINQGRAADTPDLVEPWRPTRDSILWEVHGSGPPELWKWNPRRMCGLNHGWSPTLHVSYAKARARSSATDALDEGASTSRSSPCCPRESGRSGAGTAEGVEWATADGVSAPERNEALLDFTSQMTTNPQKASQTVPKTDALSSHLSVICSRGFYRRRNDWPHPNLGHGGLPGTTVSQRIQVM